MTAFPDRLREMMTLAQVNQVDLAKRTGLNQSNISQYLKGAVEPTLASLLALARALHCTLEELTGLPALKDAESKLPSIPEDAKKFAEFYASLVDGDPRKEYLRYMMKQAGFTLDNESETEVK